MGFHLKKSGKEILLQHHSVYESDNYGGPEIQIKPTNHSIQKLIKKKIKQII